MAATEALFASLNAGEISPLALARIDLAKLRVACSQQENWLVHSLGPTMVRPGLRMIQEIPSDIAGWLGEFVYDANMALLVVTPNGFRPLVSDNWITRPSVASVITNPTFTTDLSGWTNSDEAGAVSAWVAGSFMGLTGTGANYAFRDQQVTVAGGDVGHEHGIRLVVAHGNVRLMIGTAQGDGTYWDVTLRPGTYSFSFVPSGNFWIRLGANDAFPALVTSIAVELTGPVSIPIPWAPADFNKMRYCQSGNIVFVVCDTYQQRAIVRFVTSITDVSMRSWGIALYQPDDGPFMPDNLGPITIAPSGINGSTTLTASRGLFQPGQVGGLFQLTQSGQSAIATLAGANQFTGTIRVAGLSSKNPGDPPISQRDFAINISGTWVATVTLQRSLGVPGSWTDVDTYTTNQAIVFDDGLDNQIVYYRLAIKTANYTSGSAIAALTYTSSSQTGVCRITSVAGGGVTAVADVIKQFGTAGQATSTWAEGEWSAYRGFPAGVALHEGRLSFVGPTIDIDHSVSDAFASFDPTVIGDSGPIDKTLPGKARWLLSLQRLIAGTWRDILSIRASALDEPLTPTAWVARTCADRGASPTVRPIKIDQQGVFVGRDSRVYELDWSSVGGLYIDYSSRDLTLYHPEASAAGVVDMAVRRNPDTTMFLPLADGTVLAITYNKEEQIVALTPITSRGAGGNIERGAVLPNANEDDVYFIVQRTIGGVTRRFIEKLTRRSECIGGTFNQMADCFLAYGGAPTNVISGLSYLNGQQVIVWADGGALVVDQAHMLTVSGGSITLPNGYTAANAIVGLPYTATLLTAKLALAGDHGTPLEQQKRVAGIGLVMTNTCPVGVRVGRDVNHLGGLPATYRGKALTANQVFATFDARPAAFAGGWDSDARVCIQVQAPYPATINALVLTLTTNEPDDGPPPAADGKPAQ